MWAILNDFLRDLSLHFWRKCDIRLKVQNTSITSCVWNHSVNAAIVYNEGEIIVNTVIDISEVLEKYRFDGKKYVNIETNKKVNIKNLKNNSESFTYTFGLLFEMARVLKNAKDKNGYVYYDVN